MGRTGHPAGRETTLGIAILLVIAAGSVVAGTRGEGPLAQAVTTVVQAGHARIVHPDGSSETARAGGSLRAGDVVRTAHGGHADLRTRSRVTYLGPSSALAVLDGARQQLRTGDAVVDAQHGPGLALAVAGTTLAIPAGAAAEARRSTAVTLGVLAGSSVVTGAGGRTLRVAALGQVAVTGDALATVATPLTLSDDRGETLAAPALVRDDVALLSLARGLDRSGAAAGTVVDASWDGSRPSTPRGLAPSEQALPILIAESTPRSAGSSGERLAHATTWRAEGGSWGVVLRLLSGRSAAVLRTFDALSRIASPPPAVATRVATTTTATGPTGGATAPGPERPAGSATDGSRPTGRGGPPPPPPRSHPTPSPSQGVLGALVTTTGRVIKGVVSLVPLPSSSPSPRRSASLLPGR